MKTNLRYWEIIIGPWLKSFLGIVHNRYYRVAEAIKLNEISCFVNESKMILSFLEMIFVVIVIIKLYLRNELFYMERLLIF